MKKTAGFLAATAAAALLVACGGGGGSSGETHGKWTLELRADRTLLPINIDNELPSIGAYHPFTTTLYVNAWENGRPVIPADPDEDFFACNVEGGLNTGALYYLDGDEDHEVEVTLADGTTITVPGAYRSITLGGNSGGNSFHFHSGDEAGVATVRCTVVNPRDNRVAQATVDIQVGSATGMPASVVFQSQAPHYLGTQGNIADVRSNVGLEVIVMDDANQRIPDPAAHNVRVRILPTPAGQGAKLVWQGQSGQSVNSSTVNGVAQFSLESGPDLGLILLELTVDRLDNDVSNGIQQPITQLLAVPVVQGIPTGPLAIEPVEQIQVKLGESFIQGLVAQGGVLPYLWSATGLPEGVTLHPSGVIWGTPAKPGPYVVLVSVTDANGDVVETTVHIQVTAEPLVIDTTSISVTLGNSATVALQASGGVPFLPSDAGYASHGPYKWSGSGVRSDGIFDASSYGVGTHQTVVTVEDRIGQSVNGTLTIDVKKPEN